VHEAVKIGCQATGVDINAPSTRNGNETYIKSSIEDFVLRPNNQRFDVIVMSHSLEHLSDHRKILCAVEKHLLKGSGKLAIVVPNPYSMSAQVFRRNWGYWQVPVHLHHFSVRSLQSTVELSGLQLVRRQFRGADSLFWILTLMNCLKAKAGEATSVKMRIVRYLSWVLTGYMYFGSEDIMMLFERRFEMASST
jgi:SAM-dependent methyltransferase